MTTSNNLEVRNAQVFGDSWALGQVSGIYIYFRAKQIFSRKHFILTGKLI